MTDNNADETAENNNLSRRTALALMGTSAVGGAAATSAFSKLTADRPIDVEVVSSGADSETSDSGGSELQITNNDSEAISATISTSSSNVNLVGFTGSSSASISGSNPWDLTSLGANETAQIEFRHDSSTTTVDFDVEAFSATNGFSIATTQSVSLSAIPSSGVARWTLDNARVNGNTVYDVWNGNDLSNNGATTGQSGSNQTYTTNEAFSFNSSNNDHVSDNNNAVVSSYPFTFAAWTKTSDTSKQSIITVGSTNSDTPVHGVAFDSDGRVRGFTYNSNYTPTSSSTSFTDGSWYHVIFVAESDTISLYIDDGSGASESTSNSQSVGSVGRTSIGRFTRNTNSVEYHDGSIDDVRVYDKALTSTERTNLYNNGDINDGS